MTCPQVEGCPLFRLFTLRASLSLWKANYCDAAFATCERLRISERGKHPPPNMLPNGKLLHLASELTQQGG
jgi:hypothetical protein